jgi:hypothetical protein
VVVFHASVVSFSVAAPIVFGCRRMVLIRGSWKALLGNDTKDPYSDL